MQTARKAQENTTASMEVRWEVRIKFHPSVSLLKM
jgi:hypothetical protein